MLDYRGAFDARHHALRGGQILERPPARGHSRGSAPTGPFYRGHERPPRLSLLVPFLSIGAPDIDPQALIAKMSELEPKWMRGSIVSLYTRRAGEVAASNSEIPLAFNPSVPVSFAIVAAGLPHADAARPNHGGCGDIFPGFLIGGNAAHVVNHAPCSVLVVRE